ncbi:nSTAND1 domain-containing NTPase [Streptomyces sp. NPDC003691]
MSEGNRETPADLQGLPRQQRAGEEVFGARLRRLRAERGLSLAELSRRAHYSRGYISKVENGRKPVTYGFAVCCDDALEADGLLIALAPGNGGKGGPAPCPYPGLAAFRTEEADWFFGREPVTAELVARLAEKARGPAGAVSTGRWTVPGPAPETRPETGTGTPTGIARETGAATGTGPGAGPGTAPGPDDGPLVVVGPSGAGKSSLLHAGLLPALARGALPVPGSAEWPVAVLTPTAHPLLALAHAVARAVTAGAAAGGPGGRGRPPGPTPDALFLALLDGTFPEAVRAAAPTGMLVVADQFEEVFTLCPDPAERRGFITALCALSRPALVVLGVRADFYGRCLEHPELVTALRRSQLPLGPMTPAELRTAITGPAERTSLTLEPGLVDVLLRDAGVDDDSPRPGGAHALPLMAHALLTTWQQREDDRMTVAAYRRTGGIRGAVAASAERVYGHLDAPGRATARQLLLCLVQVGDAVREPETGGDGGHHDTRRRVGHERLRALLPDPERADGVLAAFAGARLLSLGAEGVEITHEALLHAWPRLRRWIDADRAGLRGRQRLVEAAEAWEKAGRDPALLYRGAQLELAADWLDARRWEDDARRPGELPDGPGGYPGSGHVQDPGQDPGPGTAESPVPPPGPGTTKGPGQHPAPAPGASSAHASPSPASPAPTTPSPASSAPTTPERRFLDASLAHREAEAAAVRRRTRRLRQLVSALSALSLLTGAATAFALFQRAAALAERDVSAAQVAVDHAERMRQVDPAQAMRLSLAAYRLVRTPATRGALLASSGSVFSTPAGGHQWSVNRLAFTDRPAGAPGSGELLVSSGEEGTVHLTDVRDPARPLRTAVVREPHPGTRSAVTPDGRLLASGGDDATVRIRDLRAGRALVVSLPAGAPVTALAFSPDGRRLAAGGKDGSVRTWLLDGARTGAAARADRSHAAAVTALAYRPDGAVLASASDDCTVQLWRTAPGSGAPRPAAVLEGHRAQVRTVAFSPDGRLLASGSFDRTVRLTLVSDPGDPGWGRELKGHQGLVNSVAFRGDGRQLASAADDQTTRLWDVASGRATLTLPQPNPVRSVAYGPGGRILATGDDEGRRLLWHLPPPVLLGPPGGLPAVHALPGGRLLAATGGDGSVPLWRTGVWGPDSETPVGVLRGHTGAVTGLDTDASGRLLATGGDDGTARLWDLRDPRRPVELARIDRHRDMVYAVALSEDGRLLVTAGEDRRARVWDVSDPRRPVLLKSLTRHSDRINGVALGGPGDRTLVTAGGDYQARVWDLRDPRRPVLRATLPHPNQVNRAALAPGGRFLATTNDDRRVRLWDLARLGAGSPAPVTRPVAVLVGHREASREVAFSPDGGTLVTTSDDRTAQLWSLADVRRPVVLTALPGHGGPVTGAVFSPDGRTLVTAGTEGTVRFWSHDVAAVVRRICALDGPGFGRAEWAEHFPDQEYRRSCG